MLAHSYLIRSSSKLLVTRTGIKAWMSLISGLWFPWPIYMFFEMRFDLGTLDSGERSLPFGLLVSISHSNVILYIVKFMTNISQELLHVGFCNLVQVLWFICCFMWKRTRFLLLILPLIIFLSLQFSNIKKKLIFLFSGTESHTKLKLGLHMDSGLMYHVYLNRAAGVYYAPGIRSKQGVYSFCLFSNNVSGSPLAHFLFGPRYEPN